MTWKNVISVLGAGSIAGFFALFMRIAHFARLQLLVGTAEDVEMTAAATVYRPIAFAFQAVEAAAETTNWATTHILTASAIVGVTLIIVITLTRSVWSDSLFLLSLVVVACSLFALLDVPFLPLQHLINDRMLHPEEVIPLNAPSRATARYLWQCIICEKVSDLDTYSPQACSGMAPLAARLTLTRSFGANIIMVALLVVAGTGYWVARGSIVSALGGGPKGAIVVLALLAVGFIALDVYSVAYVYGKTRMTTRFDVVRIKSGGQFYSPWYRLAETDTTATSLASISGIDTVHLKNMEIQPLCVGPSDVLTQYVIVACEQELRTKGTMLGVSHANPCYH